MPNALFGVAKKTPHNGEICQLGSETVAQMSRRAAFCIDFWKAALLPQKPFAIGQRDGEDRPTVAGPPSSYAYSWPEVKG